MYPFFFSHLYSLLKKLSFSLLAQLKVELGSSSKPSYDFGTPSSGGSKLRDLWVRHCYLEMKKHTRTIFQLSHSVVTLLVL
jgi:hypothetical protein